MLFRSGLHSGERVTVKGVGSSTVGYWPQPFTAAINDLRLPRRYLVVDLCKLQASCQCRVDGLLGADFMDGRVVQVDFEARKIRLLRSTQNVIGETIKLKKRRDVWQVPLRVNGSATAWFRLDTGCASGLQWVTGTSGPQPTSTKISVALTEMSLPVTETTVNAGTTTVTGVSTTLHRSELFSGEAGLVGAGFLSRFSVVTLDAKANRLILTPRSAE